MNRLLELTTDPEFADQIPPLGPQEYERLEESILEEGAVIHPIITWNGIIVDGHHRYRIICEHPELQIRYEVYEKSFPDRYAAMAWICQNQLGRRNLTPEQKKYLIGKQYEAQKHSDSFNGNRYTFGNESRVGQSGPPYKHGTRSRIAQETNTNEAYVRRAAEYARGIDLAEETVPGTRQKILSGSIKPSEREVKNLLDAANPEDRKYCVAAFHDDKKASHISKKDKLDPNESDSVDDEEAPITSVTLREVRETADAMDHSDRSVNEDDVIFELNDALDALIFRWNKCVEMNPEAASGVSYRSRRDELIQKGMDFLKKFQLGGTIL